MPDDSTMPPVARLSPSWYVVVKLMFWMPVIFRGTLWVMIYMLTEAVSTLVEWKHQVEAGKWFVTELDVWILTLKMWLAGALGCRLFLDQSYSRHIIDNMPEGQGLNPKTSETEFIRKQLAKVP